MEVVPKLAAGQRLRIVTYGTSLTAEGSSFWVSELREILSVQYPGLSTVINSGQAAMWSGWGVENLDPRVIQKNPDVVFIEFGINDSFRDYRTSLTDYRRNVENMVSRILKAKPSCEIILMTMNYPIREHLSARPDVEQYYQVYREIAKEQDLKIIDIFPKWKEINIDDPALYDYLVPDGIHPAREGTALVIIPAILRSLDGLKSLVPVKLLPRL